MTFVLALGNADSRKLSLVSPPYKSLNPALHSRRQLNGVCVYRLEGDSAYDVVNNDPWDSNRAPVAVEMAFSNTLGICSWKDHLTVSSRRIGSGRTFPKPRCGQGANGLTDVTQVCRMCK